jgi:hypothetical protein
MGFSRGFLTSIGGHAPETLDYRAKKVIAEREARAARRKELAERRAARRAGVEAYPAPAGTIPMEVQRDWSVIHRGLYVQTIPPRFCYDNRWHIIAPATARILASLVDAAANGREYVPLWDMPCVGRPIDTLIYTLRLKLPPSVTIVNHRSLGYGITIKKRPSPMDIKQRAAGLANQMPEGCVAVALVAIGPDGKPVVVTPPRTSPIGLIRMFGLAQIAVADQFQQVPARNAPAPAVDTAAEDASLQAAVDAKDYREKYDSQGNRKLPPADEDA